jgi:hypothetical protein
MQSRSLRVLVSVAALAACLWASWASGRTALSRILVKYGMTTANADALDAAIRLTPVDAEGHYDRGVLANYLGQPVEALGELELAVSLRPRDYALWLDLGMTRDELHDADGALTALNESVRLAPYYSKPRYQRGNLLFRMGRYDEAFADLRNAADRDPGVLPGLIDLAWGASGHDPVLTEQIVQSQGGGEHLALAFFFANRGRPDNALAQFGLAKNVTDEKRGDLVRALAAAGAFTEAFTVWRNGNSIAEAGPLKGAIYDGGFEHALTFDDSSFGWRPARGAGLSLSLDQNFPHTGTRSLRIDFNGDSNPDSPIVSQLVLVEPASHYKLSFAARTKNIVTGGPPLVVIGDSSAVGAPGIAITSPFPANSESWQVINLEFLTGATTKAVMCSLKRERCATSPCPIFGSLNLDSFVLERSSEQSKH